MKLLLIDGNSIINRAYYAIPPLNDIQGRNVNAVYGFCNIYFKILDNYKPTHAVVAFDMRGDNFRKKLYTEYKANRKGMPDDLAMQLDILRNLLSIMNIKVVESAGIEADDIIGTLTKSFNCEKLIVSGDKDLFQLVDSTTTMLLTKKGVSEVETISIETLQQLYQLTPEQVIDYKALCGDASDNIPGVKGIGEKSAMMLINKYRNLDNIYSHIDEISGSIGDKLWQGKELAYVSKQLATIVTNYSQLICSYDDCVIKALPSIVADEFNKLQFRTLLKRINVSSTQEEAKPIVKVDQIVINTVDKLQDIVNKLRHSDLLSIYIGEHLYIANSATVEYKVELINNFLSGITLEQALEILSPILASDISKCVYDSKHLKHLLLKQNKQINNIKYDISIMQYIVEYRSFKDFEALTSNYNLSNYASSLISLSEILLAKLTADNEIKLYNEIELPLMQVLYQMEVDGVKVDKTILNELGNRFCDEISVLSKEIYELSGQVFNIASPKQLGEVLFEKLSLPTSKKTKSGFSTDADVLAKLVDVHPIVPLVIKVRQLNKLYGTYIEGIRQLITKESLVHTTYNQTLTSTGRLSSSDPNMQNIPIRDEVGREIRKMFVPRYDLLISADYSQIELRLLAHFSQDEVLIETFNNGIDIHSRVASEIFNVPIELINANMRRAAKAVNFGIIYGISQYGLSQNIGITFSQASKYISKYFESYPKIKAYLNSSVSDAKRDGFVTTITGRRRQIPELKSANAQIRAFGERAAMNMPLQGSAADIIKIAMINVSKALKANKLQSKLIMQVHDELVIDTVESEKEKVQDILKYEMQNAIKTRVVLEVNISSGVNLFDAK